MTTRRDKHLERKVNAWIQDVTSNLSPAKLLSLFELVMVRLWNRSHILIGDVTLTAITDRALFNSSEIYKLLDLLQVDYSGIQFHKLHQSNSGLNPNEIIRSFKELILEFITIVGSVTGDILLEPLLQELLTTEFKGEERL